MPAVTHASEPSLLFAVSCDCRFALDCLLRHVGGYRIWRRPRCGEAVWLSPVGQEVRESVALKALSRHAVDDARYAQELYLSVKYGE